MHYKNCEVHSKMLNVKWNILHALEKLSVEKNTPKNPFNKNMLI